MSSRSGHFVLTILADWSRVPPKTATRNAVVIRRNVFASSTTRSTTTSLGLLYNRQPLHNRYLKSQRCSLSTTSTASRSSNDRKTVVKLEKVVPTDSQLAYDRLRPVVDAFEAPIDWAVAYGSGVIHQANQSQTGEAPLTDFIFSTPSPSEFHRINLRQHPGHYPFFAKLAGGRVLGWMQDNLGAGVWYVTMVDIHGIQVKYGVISTEKLKKDLERWDTLYIAGRLHKPVLTLQENQSLSLSFNQNLKSALTLALLLLPPDRPFTELQLWEGIAGISYSGDPRMSVPGAENPQKVKNIVRGPGVLQGLREKYGALLEEAKDVGWESDEKIPSWKWIGEGEGQMTQPASSTYLAGLLSTLPINLRKGITKHFRPTIVGALVSPEVKAERATSPARRRRDIPDEGDRDFWIKVVEQDRFREVVLNELRHIIRRPALTQSFKGILTAGFVKSVQYSLAKFRKWLAGRRSKGTVRSP